MMRFIFALYLYAGFVSVSFFQATKQPLTTNEWWLRIGVNALAVVVLGIGANEFRKQRKFLGFEARLFYPTVAICYVAGIGLGYYASKLQSLL